MTYSREQISELLSRYDSDELTPKERAVVEQCLANDPDVRSELEAQRAMQDLFGELKNSLKEPDPIIFKRIESRLEAERMVKRRSGVREFIKRTRAHILSLLPKPQIAWGVAAIQMAVLVVLVSSYRPESVYNTLSHSPAGNETSVRVNIVFDPSAMEQDIREILRVINASIVEGPTEEGLYVITVPAGADQDALLKTLRTSKVVTLAEPSL